MKRLQTYPLLWTCLLVFFCGHIEAQEDKALDQVYINFSKAYTDLDTSIIRSIYHPEAKYLTPDGGVKSGIAKILPGFTGMFESARTHAETLHIAFAILKREISGDMAYDVGYYQLKRSKGNEVMGPWVGKFVTILKQQANGKWQFVVDTYNDAPVEAFETAKLITP